MGRETASRKAHLSDSATATRPAEHPTESIPPNRDSPNHLLNIAPELRLLIYEKYLTSYTLDYEAAIQGYHNKEHYYQPPLLRTDPRITHEALPIYRQHLIRRLSEVEQEFTAYIAHLNTATATAPNDTSEQTRKKYPLFAACSEVQNPSFHARRPNDVFAAAYNHNIVAKRSRARARAQSCRVQVTKGYAAELIRVQRAREGKVERYLVEIMEYGMNPSPRQRLVEMLSRVHNGEMGPMGMGAYPGVWAP